MQDRTPRSIKRCLLVVLTILLIGQMLWPMLDLQTGVDAAPIKKINKFQGGALYKDITFSDMYTDTASAKFEFQKGINVTNTTFLVDGQTNLGSYPTNITIDVGGNGLPDWRWAGIGYGAMGHQEYFVIKDGADQNLSANLTIPGGGGDNKTASIRLPAGAKVTNASVQLEVKGVAIAIECKTGSNSCNTPNNDPVYSLQSAFSAMGWTSTIVTGTDIDTVDELSKYTVVVLGDAGFNDDDHATFQAALKTWVTQNGGGLVGTGWILYSTVANSDMDFLLPVSGGYGYSTSGQVTITNGNHPVTQGVNNFNVPNGAFCEYPSSASIDAGAQTLGTCSNPTIVVSDKGAGRTVYLGPNYFGDFQSYQSAAWYNDANGKKLIQQAALWASGGGSLSGYVDIGNDGNKEWDKQAFNGSEYLPDFSTTLNNLLGSAVPSLTDPYGNKFVDIPITVHSTSAGMISLKNLTITYTYSAKAQLNPHNGTLSNEINGLIPDVLAATNVTIPIHVSSDTAGIVKLHSFNADIVDPVHAPTLTSYGPTPDRIEIDENNTINFKVAAVDWYRYPLTYKWFLDDKENTTGETYDYFADFDSQGTHNVTVKISNGNQETWHWWIVVVKNVNRPPRIISYTPTLQATVYENTTNTFTVNAVDPDKGDPVGFNWVLDSVPGGSSSNTFDYKPTYRDAGMHNLDVTAKDPKSAKASMRWTIEVLNVNAAPEIISWGPKTNPTTLENSTMSFMVKARAPDDDSLFYSWYIDGKAATSADKPTFDYKPGFSDAGEHALRAQVSDGSLSANHTWTVTVTDVNRPPVGKIFSPKEDAEFLTSDNITFSGKGSTDPDGDKLTFDWYKGMTKVGTGENATFKLPKGLQTIDLRVDDGKDGIVTAQVTVTVRELKFQVTIAPDLTAPRDGDKVKFKVTVQSIGDADGVDVPVSLYIDGQLVDTRSLDAIYPDDTQTVDFDWTAKEGTHNVRAEVAQDKVERSITVQKALIPGVTGNGNNLLLPIILIVAIVCGVVGAAAVMSRRKKKARAQQEATAMAASAQTATVAPAPVVAQPVASPVYETYQQPIPPPSPGYQSYGHPSARPLPPPPPPSMIYSPQPPVTPMAVPTPAPTNFYSASQPAAQQYEPPPIAVARATIIQPAVSSAGEEVGSELQATEALVDKASTSGKDVTRAKNHLRLAKFFHNKGDRTKALDYCRKAKEAIGN